MTGPGRARRAVRPDADAPVTTLELFFDLVFVFTVTQVTGLVAHTGGAGYLQAASVLVLIWWMYDGYAWLSNNVGPTTPSTQLPMLVAMAAFLLMAMAVPEAYGADAWLFALAYLVVVLVHAVSFTRSSLGDSARAILAIAPVNLSAAALLLVAAALPEDWRWVCWWLAVGVLVVSMVTRRESGFALRPGHFAERHRLLLIIALGESVIAVGVAGQAEVTEVPVLLTVLLSLALVVALWWVEYAAEEPAAAALEEVHRTEPTRTVRVALFAFSIAYLVMVAGLILVAAVLHDAVHDPGHALSWRLAVTMAGGAAAYLLGHALHLHWLGLPSGRVRKLAAVLCLATAVLGHAVSGAAQVVAIVVVLAVLAGFRDVLPVGRRGSPAT